MSGTRIALSELQVLMNLLDPDRMSIAYPLYDFDIMKARPRPNGYYLDIPSSLSFDDSVSRFQDFGKEMPNFYDFRTCMISSGLQPFLNIDEIESSVSRFRKLRTGVSFGLDTNMMYNNFVRNHGFICPDSVVLVDTCLDEIKFMLNRKYSEADIRAMQRPAGPNGKLAEELFNRRTKVSRKAANLALAEWLFLESGGARQIKGLRPSSFKEGESDMIIVDTYRDHDRENAGLTVLLTADEAMTDLCKADGIEYIKCDLPHRVEAADCSFREFNRLVFIMAKVFGFVKIGPVTLYGEYGGYTSNDEDSLKAVTDNPDLHFSLERELALCRRLRALGIGQ